MKFTFTGLLYYLRFIGYKSVSVLNSKKKVLS